MRETEAENFKTLSRVQRSEAPALLAVSEGAEITEGSFGERRETYALTSYGRIFSITRQAMVNDDLGAFTTLPQAFGQAARRKEADVVYSILTANADMSDSVDLFHATHRNLSGVSGSITLGNLGIARAAMRKADRPRWHRIPEPGPAIPDRAARARNGRRRDHRPASRSDVPNPKAMPSSEG
ncbi:MAG: hypothetical protein IPO95_08765 [Rhodanobacteraceae bacterium]|nr:hypothetical protein [Rhodanobacteraceae bacterium]